MTDNKVRRCAIYTRKSSTEGLDQSFNSLDAQREAAEAYIVSQKHEGWTCIKERFDDGGFSGGNMERPALLTLIEKIKQKLIDVIVVYKVDRLSRSLADFAKLVELFDQYEVSFVSVTQHFNTSTSMGRLTLNVLLSFAQFEREVTGERIRDKIAASKKKGMWMGGNVPLGYEVKDRQLHINKLEANTVKRIFDQYLELQSVRALKQWLDESSFKSKHYKTFSRGALYRLLRNPVYIGKIKHKDITHVGNHQPILKNNIWEKTQLLLNTNKNKNTNRARSHALLSGILFDDRGNAMSPTHTKKGNKRYQYYVSQALLQYKDQQTGSIQRISMQEVDRAVIDALNHTKAQEEIASILLKHIPARQYKQTQTKLHRLLDVSDLDSGGKRMRISLLMYQAVINTHTVKLSLSLSSIAQALDIEISENKHYEITHPLQRKHWGSEQKFVAENKSTDEDNNASLKSLQDAITKAFVWNEELQSGKAPSIKALAEKENVTSAYIRRLLRLAYLSPKILDNVFIEPKSATLTLEGLREIFSLYWKLQNNQFRIH
tara:strand:+ start:31090 stop:32730 length:1641 start_codon:yes stop_codon:yes gene_type:complete